MRFQKLFLLGLTTAALFAQTATRPGAARAGAPRPAAQGVAAVKNYLGLSEQQVQQLAQLRREERPVIQPLREQLQAKMKELNTARQAASPNPTVVGQLLLDAQNLRERIRAVNEDYHGKALALLDSTQKDKLDNLEQAMQRAARARAVVNGATALNLMLPPIPARGARAAQP